MVAIGQHVQPDAHPSEVMTICHPESLRVRSDINLADLEKISLGQPCEVRVDAARDQVFSGVVSRVLHEANILKNTVQVKVSLDNASGIFKPEMLVRVRFLSPKQIKETRAGEFVQMVPERALVKAEGGAHVFVVAGAGKTAVAKRVPVTLGPGRDGELVEVKDGLNPSSKVILNDLDQLRDGEPVKVGGGHHEGN
jgi:RND family efflux transporter MFP subunit